MIFIHPAVFIIKQCSKTTVNDILAIQ